jgi:cell division protein FtsI/penicillin-binding protein 2
LTDKTDRPEKIEIGRRVFMRSVFGLGTLKATEGSAIARQSVAFFWCNIKNGQVGFPTGFSVPHERPGSIMKLVAAAALLEEGLFSPNQELECTGTYRVGREDVHCQKAHGKIDIVKALGFSCNVFFARATHHLTSRAFLAQARALGLASGCAGRPAGPFPADERLPDSSLHYVLGLAEDLKPSSLALLRLAALIAVGAGGILPVLHSAEDFELKEKESPFKNPLSNHTNEILQHGMRLCAREGTARKLDQSDNLKLAVKTGTTPHGNKFQSLLIGYFPIDDPRHAICLVSPSGTSQDSAVPKAREFLTATTWP